MSMLVISHYLNKCVICGIKIDYCIDSNNKILDYIKSNVVYNMCFNCFCNDELFISKTSAKNDYFLSEEYLGDIYSFSKKNPYDNNKISTYYILEDVINLSNLTCPDREKKLEKRFARRDEKIKKKFEEIIEEEKCDKYEKIKREYYVKSLLEKTNFPDKNIDNNEYFKKYIETGEQYAESNIFGKKKIFDNLMNYIDYVDIIETRKREINEKIDNICHDRSIANIIKKQNYYKKFILEGGDLINNIENIINDNDGYLFFEKCKFYIKDIQTKNPKLTMIKYYIKNNGDITKIPSSYHHLIEKTQELIKKEKISYDEKKISEKLNLQKKLDHSISKWGHIQKN
jgi:hypothetical protein